MTSKVTIEISKKVRAICDDYLPRNCVGCPLKRPCVYQCDDDRETFINRVNEAANNLKGK